MPRITLPRAEGTASRQAHTDLPANTYERELGREGFFGPATHMHHRHAPTGWSSVEGPLRPRAFDTRELDEASDVFSGGDLLFANPNVQVRFMNLAASMGALARNADGDELVFVHQGEGDLYCDYGHLRASEGDYLLLPRGTCWRLEVSTSMKLLTIEACGSGFSLPDKGIVGQHAVFDPMVLEVPSLDENFTAQQDENPWQVVVKRHNRLSTITYPFNPLDAVGWHGTLMPVRLNWRDIRPLMSHRYHVPPSAHSTFAGDRFVVCTFVPRPSESDPGALNVPFFHSNDDYDEMIFYHRGRFFSRDHIAPGMVTLHPAGIPHGPHPAALANAAGLKGRMMDEVAVMIDTRDALEVSEHAQQVEWPDYVDSWK